MVRRNLLARFCAASNCESADKANRSATRVATTQRRFRGRHFPVSHFPGRHSHPLRYPNGQRSARPMVSVEIISPFGIFWEILGSPRSGPDRQAAMVALFDCQRVARVATVATRGHHYTARCAPDARGAQRAAFSRDGQGIFYRCALRAGVSRAIAANFGECAASRQRSRRSRLPRRRVLE